VKSLVEALRAEHQKSRERGGDMMTYGEGQPLMVEAANEIERLQAKITKADYLLTQGAPTLALEALQ
jgi:hypothetical protein